MHTPARMTINTEQYTDWSKSYRWGTTVGTVTTWDTLAGYAGYGHLQMPSGTLVDITVGIDAESVAGAGGQVVLSLDTLAVPPGIYPYDVWLTPPGGSPAFKWATGQFVIAPSVSPRPAP